MNFQKKKIKRIILKNEKFGKRRIGYWINVVSSDFLKKFWNNADIYLEKWFILKISNFYEKNFEIYNDFQKLTKI